MNQIKIHSECEGDAAFSGEGDRELFFFDDFEGEDAAEECLPPPYGNIDDGSTTGKLIP